MKYDVIVIGGGLGGLVSGFILSKEGMNVCVLEQHHQAGGNLQTFSRDGCTFETGMHYMGSLGEGQYLDRYFRYLELAGKLNLKQLDTAGSDTISFDDDDTEYPISQTYEGFTSHLGSLFPDEKPAIEAYVKKIRALIREFPLYHIAEADSYHIRPAIMQECAVGSIRNLFKNDRLQNVIGGALSLYPGNAYKTPFYVHACMRDSLINSCWRPVDGSQQIADQLVAGIRKHGGTVLTAHKVKEIMAENNIARAVRLENDVEMHAGIFISNAHPAATLNMIAEGKIRKMFRRRIMRMENSPGAFTVYAVLKPGTFPYLNKNYFHYAGRGVLHAPESPDTWPENFYFYTPAGSRTPAYAESYVVLADMHFDEVRQWSGTGVNKRGEEYEAFKQKKAALLLDRLEQRFPGIKSKTAKYYTSTPLTFRDYTATYEGTAYGIIKDCADPLRSLILPRTKISNLFFTGQNLNLHGIMGVTASAVISCSEILGIQYLTKKIANG